MAGNGIIRRLLQIILDKSAADKAEADARKTLGGIDSAASSLEKTFKRVGEAIVAFFSLRAIVEFGKSAVEAAITSEKAWSNLGGAVRAVGGNFEKVEASLHVLGEAFQSQTIHSAEDYAQALADLITRTGDVAASTQNMGLVANVAAAFYSGKLEPAVTLVSKVMDGQTTILTRLGIHVKSAQEGLDKLGSYSMNRATQEARTLSGQIQQLNNDWGDFKIALGETLTKSADAVTAMGTLKGMLATLTQTVIDNRTELQGTFKSALTGTVEVLDGVYRGIRGVAEILDGAFFLAIGVVSKPMALLIQGFALLAEGSARVSGLLGMKGVAKDLADFAKRVDAVAETLKTPMTVGLDLLSEGFKRLTERSQTAEDVLDGMAKGGPTTPPLIAPRGKPGKFVSDEETKALEAYHTALKGIEAESKLLGPAFDELGAKSSALNAVLKVFAEHNEGPATDEMKAWAAEIKALAHAQAWKDFSDGLMHIHDTARILGPDFDALGAEAALLQTHLQALQKLGKDSDDAGIKAIRARLDAISLETVARDLEKTTSAADQMWEALTRPPRSLDELFTQRLSVMSDELGRLKTAMEAIPEAMRASSPEFAAYAARYDMLQDTMAKTSEQQKLILETAKDVGGAMMAALEGSLGAYAAGKAKQNLLEAAELGLQAVASGIFTLGLATGPMLALAAEHTAIAAGWAAIAGASGGFSGAARGGGGGASLASARGASASAASQAAPQVSVTIVLSGPGFNALNPAVQRVLWGAMAQARERYGENANIRVTRAP